MAKTADGIVIKKVYEVNGQTFDNYQDARRAHSKSAAKRLRSALSTVIAKALTDQLAMMEEPFRHTELNEVMVADDLLKTFEIKVRK